MGAEPEAAFDTQSRRTDHPRMHSLASLLMPAIAATVAAEPAPATVAVLYFDYAGKDPALEPLRKGLTQMLISDLAAEETIRVVERERLEAVLAEQKLGASGKIDARTAARVGKLLGARYLVLGSYFDVMRSLRVDARLVEVETGRIVQSVGAGGKPDEFLDIEQKVAAGVREAAARAAAEPTTAARRPALRPAPPPNDKHRPPPRPPKRLKTDTAIKYGEALAALDAGKKGDARTLLGTVLAAQPDFELASRDLDRLMQ